MDQLFGSGSGVLLICLEELYMYVFSLWVQVFRRPVEEEALEGVFREKHIKTALYCV